MKKSMLENLKKTVNCILVLLMVISSLTFVSNARAIGLPTLTIGSQSASGGASISVPIDASNFVDVGGITVYIQYDIAKLTYVDYTLDSLITDPDDINVVGNEIRINWYNPSSPLNMVSSTLLTLNFTVIAPTTTISFVGANEISDIVGDIIPSAVFTDGTIFDPNTALLAADKAALADADIKGANPDLANITLALTNPLPSVGSVNGSTITWASNTTGVVSNDGQTINRPAFASGNIAVTMTATLTKGTVTDTKTFNLTVLKLPASTIATVTSGSYTVSSGGTPNETITNVPYGTSQATFLLALTRSESHQTWNTSGVLATVVTGNTLVVTAQDGSTTVTYTITALLNPAKAITALNFVSPAATGIVNEGAKTVAITVPFGTDVTALVPTIAITGASISPLSGVAQDFTTPVTYTVKAADSTTEDYEATVTIAPNTAKAITAFDFASPAVTGVINEGSHTIALTVPFGTDITTLVPTITITGASISPLSGIAGNFTTPQTYTVTAANASTQAYVVTVTVLPDPNLKAITAFTISGSSTVINELAHTIAVTAPYGTVVTALVPTIAITGASISPLSGVAQNFTTPITYTVTATNATTQEYVVTVTVSVIPPSPPAYIAPVPTPTPVIIPPTENIIPTPTPAPEQTPEATPTSTPAQTPVVVVPQLTAISAVQLSPIPNFNFRWGTRYPGGKINWALAHRENIFGAYTQILNREPTAIEVNWWLQRSGDIGFIRYWLRNSEEHNLLGL